MKLLIAYILAATTSLFADTVHFSWTLNDSNTTGYRIYIGRTPFQPDRSFDMPATQDRFTTELAPHEKAWLSAFNDTDESEFAGPLEYKPIVIEAVIQSVQLGVTPLVRQEIFRIDYSLFDINMINIRTKLGITRDRLDLFYLDGGFPPVSFALNTHFYGSDFFRAFVMARLIP